MIFTEIEANLKLFDFTTSQGAKERTSLSNISFAGRAMVQNRCKRLLNITKFHRFGLQNFDRKLENFERPELVFVCSDCLPMHWLRLVNDLRLLFLMLIRLHVFRRTFSLFLTLHLPNWSSTLFYSVPTVHHRASYTRKTKILFRKVKEHHRLNVNKPS